MPRRAPSLLLLAVLLAGVPGCGDRPAGEAMPSLPLPDVVLIVIDTLRADHLSGYGYERETTPFLDRLMASGVRCEQAISPSSWSAPSHTTIITGTAPHHHQVMNWGHSIAAGVDPLAKHLKARGYATGLFSTHLSLHKSVGRIQEGCDQVEVFANEEDARALQRASEWILQAPSPFFAYICLMTPHAPYVHYPPEYDAEYFPPEAGREPRNFPFVQEDWVGEGGIPRSVRIGQHQDAGYYIDRYDRCIRYTDELIGRFHADLAGQGRGANLLTVVTSDHGEGFGEHDTFAHELYLYDFLVRVPLLFHHPTRIIGGRTLGSQVGLADIVPTILGLVGAVPPAALDGQDLTPWLEAARPYSEDRLLTGSYRCRGFDRYMVRSNRHKLLLDRVQEREELYDLASDPGERFNLLERPGHVRTPAEKALREELEELLRAHARMPAERVSVPLEDDVLAELKALGYLPEDG